MDSIREVNRGNLNRYAVVVHGLKGSSRNICAEEAGTMAETLEKAAKKGEIDFVLAHNAAFVDVVEKLVTDIADALGKMAPKHPKEKREKPDDGTLLKLIAACESYDLDGVRHRHGRN